MKQVIIALVLIAVTFSSCATKEAKVKNVYTEGDFSIELIGKNSSLLDIKITHTDGRDFAFASVSSTQSDGPVLGQLKYVSGSEGIVRSFPGGSNLFLYEYKHDEHGFFVLDKPVRMYYVYGKFQQ